MFGSYNEPYCDERDDLHADAGGPDTYIRKPAGIHCGPDDCDEDGADLGDLNIYFEEAS